MNRQRLPNRRYSEIVEFEHENRRYRATVSRFPDGRVGEVFLDIGKFGSDVHLHAQDSAILASLALQSGVPAAVIRDAIKGPIGRATASRTGIGSSNLQGLQAAAGYKGVAGSEFLDSMLKFNASVSDAKRGMGELGALFRVNGVALKGTEESFFKVADLVRSAKGDYAEQVSILQEAGLPSTREWVKLMEQGGKALRSEMADAIAGGLTSTQQLVDQAKRFDDEWNKAWTNFGMQSKSVAAQAMDALSRLSESATGLLMRAVPGVPQNMLRAAMAGDPSVRGTRLTQGQADQIYGAVGITTEAEERAKSAAATAKAMQIEIVRVGLLGQTPVAQQQQKPKDHDDRNEHRLPAAA